jgi:molybdopterin-guanine dinucleotide biosynthesis protein A
MRVAGIVLCGGQSSRMGQPKAWLPIAGEFMLGRVVRLLGTVVQPVVVVAAPDQAVPPVPAEVAVVRDPVSGRGPMQGLVVGLEALRGQAEAAYLSSCDVPFLQPPFVRRLIELQGERDLCIPAAHEHFHPLAAVYRLEVADVAATLLAEDQGRMQLLIDRVATRIVYPEELSDVDPQLSSLRNVNTPEDYQEALRQAQFP